MVELKKDVNSVLRKRERVNNGVNVNSLTFTEGAENSRPEHCEQTVGGLRDNILNTNYTRKKYIQQCIFFFLRI